MSNTQPPKLSLEPDPIMSARDSLESRGKSRQIKEPYVLFPIIAILLLAALWVGILYRIKIDRIGAEKSIATASLEIGETYEAQILRALRELDQALKVVKYSYESKGTTDPLPGLSKRDLLPPDFLFAVAIFDTNGELVSNTRPFETINFGAQEDFQALRSEDIVALSHPWKSAVTGEWKLRFSRRLNASDGAFAGVVAIEADAAYFVSGYESSKLGRLGVLGLLGADGTFVVRRTGEVVEAGDSAQYGLPIPETVDDIKATLSVNSWDNVQRYTSARQLYDFPLAVVVGLSTTEQLAVVTEQGHRYQLRLIVGSVAWLLLVGWLSRMSWQLSQSRLRAAEAKMAYAERVEYLAYHDGLTALPNRSLFSKLLEQSISSAHRNNRRLAVLFLDLDRFKYINDTLGHEAGDHLLQEIAVRLQGCLRDSDTVARLGGDEFVVLLPELSEDKYAATVAQKILSSTAKPVSLAGQEFRVTVSIGISVYPEDGLDEQTLKKNADIAMYQAKQQGKNNFQFFTEKLNAESLERLTLEVGLRHALEHEEFQLHYQAKRDTRSGHITGMEVLLRWQHPDLGTVAPMQFIPIAEETGLIIPIGKWVLKTACLQNLIWQQQGLPSVNMAINLTVRQFSDEHLMADISAILAETGMDARLLEFEIAESLLMRDVKKNLRILTDLKAMGVRIAIDDFGISYSSLAALQQFPLDSIKIDRSFVRDVASVDEGKALTESIISMGRSLSLTVVAQGVETKEQADFLRDRGCSEFQGFYFDKPVPADQFETLLKEQSNIRETLE